MLPRVMLLPSRSTGVLVGRGLFQNDFHGQFETNVLPLKQLVLLFLLSWDF